MLGRQHRFHPRTEPVAGPGLDLAEHDRLAPSHDEVDLPFPATPVAFDELVAVVLVPLGRQRFACFAECPTVVGNGVVGNGVVSTAVVGTLAVSYFAVSSLAVSSFVPGPADPGPADLGTVVLGTVVLDTADLGAVVAATDTAWAPRNARVTDPSREAVRC